MNLVRALMPLFNPQERWKLLGLVALSGISTLLELGGVFSIMPFVAILSQTHRAIPLPWVGRIHHSLGLETPLSQLVFWAFTLISILTLVQICNYLSLQWGYRLARLQSLRISRRLFEGYLHQPYLQHLEGDSSQRLGFLTSAQRLSVEVYFPLLQLLVRGVSALGLGCMLLRLAPGISLLGAAVLAPIWVSYYRHHRKKISHFHGVEFEGQTRLGRKLAETFATLRLVYMHSAAAEVVKAYLNDFEQLSRQQEKRRLLEELPKWGLHLSSQLILLSMAILLFAYHPNSDRVLPTVALFALTGYRLIPTLQACLSSLVSLEGAGVLLQKLWAEIYELAERDPTPVKAMDWKESVALRGISFSYAGRNLRALTGVNLEIARGQKVALVGETGSGKTTLIQILCGLLTPTVGQIVVDGQALSEEQLARWRAGIGYASQDLELVLGSLEANITLHSGPAPDRERLHQSLRVVGLESWIESLPEGIQTAVGERGLRLSGGQRQRLALARALYRNPSLLILDEATSQLNQNLEDEILERLFRLQSPGTLLCITHRLAVLPAFDRIYVLKGGVLVAGGTYAEVVSSGHLAELGQAP